jgi:hypothetical protein
VDPAGEVAKFKVDGLIFSDHDEGVWCPGENFASVLNRLRGKGSTSPWDPAAEIQKLRADSMINTMHDPAETVNWGYFAAVFNGMRGR